MSPPTASPRAKRPPASPRGPPSAPPAAPLTFPGRGAVSVEWVRSLAAALGAASWRPPSRLPDMLPAATAVALIDALGAVLQEEPTVVDVSDVVGMWAAGGGLVTPAPTTPPRSLQLTPPPHARVVVVGDTHGHFHDVVAM